jgi:uncharacterized protein (DUF3820 family)
MMKMTDTSLMPFGKFQNQKMANVPASYLIWAYKNITNLRADLKMYIEENMHVLEMQAKATKHFR